MAKHVPRFTLITQNVDDLHERAGSRDVLHLHGELVRPYCENCMRLTHARARRRVKDVARRAVGAGTADRFSKERRDYPRWRVARSDSARWPQPRADWRCAQSSDCRRQASAATGSGSFELSSNRALTRSNSAM
jgi:hypothetical protein